MAARSLLSHLGLRGGRSIRKAASFLRRFSRTGRVYLMSSDESPADARLDQIEARLDRLEQTVAALCEAVETALDADVALPEPSSTGDEAASPEGSSDAPVPGSVAKDDASTADDMEAPEAANTDEPPPDAPANVPSDRDTAAERAPNDHDDASAQEEDADAAPDAPSDRDVSPPSSDADSRAANPSGPSMNKRLQRYATTLGPRSEDWISYVGIGLLLFGLAILFKYSIDQGWLTPTVRVGFGALLGSLLLLGGARRSPDRPLLLRQILFGGSSAAFYGTIFAAYQLYGLVSYPLAFGSMVFITVATIALAVQTDHASTALIGVAGGLGTPFLLSTDAGSGAGLALYTCLVLAGACAIYLYRGWRSLVYLATAGGWLVLMGAPVNATLSGNSPNDAWGIQGGLVGAWLLLGSTPVLRAYLCKTRPSHWPVLSPPAWSWLGRFLGRHPIGPVTASPLLAFVASRLLWPGAPDHTWAVVAGAGALGYGLLYVALQRLAGSRYAPAHGLVAAVLLTYGVSDLLGGPSLLAAWAVEAVLLLQIGRRLDDRLLRLAGHALFVGVGLWMVERLASPVPDDRTPLLRVPALLELGVLSAGLGAARLSATTWRRWSYRGAVLAGWLSWSLHELGGLPNGQAYVSVVWGSTAAALLLGGAWTRHPLFQKTGLAVLVLFVGKLFFVDLDTLSALGRVVLFLGAGSGFLLISYLLPDLSGAPADDAESRSDD